jgi:hypothetical protein
LINGYNILLYSADANFIQLGWSLSPICENSVVIIPPDHTNHSAKNLADTMMIIPNTPKRTNLIHPFNESSLSDVIILYQPINANVIHSTINISIT